MVYKAILRHPLNSDLRKLGMNLIPFPRVSIIRPLIFGVSVLMYSKASLFDAELRSTVKSQSEAIREGLHSRTDQSVRTVLFFFRAL